MRLQTPLSLLAISLGLTTAAPGTPNTGVPLSPRGGHVPPFSVTPSAAAKSKRNCLSQSDVDTLVEAYRRMITKWDDADAVYLASNFHDSSDSINQMAGIPLGQPTFPSKEAFIEHQHVQPDNLPITITHKSPSSCDEIALIWTVKFGITQMQVRGVTILGAVKETESENPEQTDSESEDEDNNEDDDEDEDEEDSDTEDSGGSGGLPVWKIKSIDVEFNNIAYLINIGGKVLMPGQACPAAAPASQ